MAINISLGTFEIVLSSQKHFKYSISLKAPPLRGKKTPHKIKFKKKKPIRKKLKKEKKNFFVEQKPKSSEEKKIPLKQVLVQQKKNFGTRLLIVSALKNNA